jgi:outer membrane receptor protein involved in Fe transport
MKTILEQLKQLKRQEARGAFAGTRQHERQFALHGAIVEDIRSLDGLNARERRHNKRAIAARYRDLHSIRELGNERLNRKFGDTNSTPSANRLFDFETRFDRVTKFHTGTLKHEPVIPFGEGYNIKQVYSKDREKLDKMTSKRH